MTAALIRVPCPGYRPPTCKAAPVPPVHHLCGEHFATDGATLEVAIYGQWLLAKSGDCEVCGRAYTAADWPIALYEQAVAP